MSKNKIAIPPSHYFWIFLIASILGAYYEEILHIVYHFFKYRVFDYSRRRGVFWGPISLVYGFGAIMFLFLLGRKERSKTEIFLKSALLGGMAEYLMSFIQELMTKTTSWDYSDKFLNIQGRTTIPYMLYWGLAGLLLIKWLYPKISRIISKVHKKTYKTITTILFVIVFLDLFVTWTALIRKELKDKGIPPYTPLGIFYDEYFDEDYIESKFPNAEDT